LRQENQTNYPSILLLYHSIAVILFTGLGIFIIFSPSSVMASNKQYKTILGILLVVYGIYRAYKAYLKLNRIREEENEQ